MREISYEVTESGIAIITINRPERRNAMTNSMVSAFRRYLREAGEDDRVKAVIMTGVPGNFCAGTDLAELSDIPSDERSELKNGEKWDCYEDTPMACPKPLIAAVDGPAAGVGAEFTSMCDFRIATPNARFGWVFSLRGLIPDTGAGTWILPRLIGVSNALELLYSGEFLSAERALAMGYVSSIVSPDELQSTAIALAERLAKGSPFSIRRIKELVYQGLGKTYDEHFPEHERRLEECFHSDDHQEGIASFLERRPAAFTGR